VHGVAALNFQNRRRAQSQLMQRILVDSEQNVPQAGRDFRRQMIDCAYISQSLKKQIDFSNFLLRRSISVKKSDGW
jgi:hypothetical protein